MKYWEDFQIGERAELGRHTFTEEEIVEFGRRYDPQPFHIDAGKRKAGRVRRLDRERLADLRRSACA